MKLSEFNRPNVRQIENDVKQALATIETKYGVNLKIGNGRFSTSEFNLKLIFKVANPSAAVKSKVENRDLQYSQLLGYNQNIIGKTFEAQGRLFTVTEIAINRPKFPIIASNNGKSYKFRSTELFKFIDK